MDAQEEDVEVRLQTAHRDDGGSGLIRGVELTPADVADTDVADALIMGNEKAVYADKAYESKERQKRLRERGRKALVSKVRAPVAGALGTLKRSYGYWRTRYVGLEKNVAEAMFKVMAYNLRRADGLREARVGAAVA